jgi:hypothetical protein
VQEVGQIESQLLVGHSIIGAGAEALTDGLDGCYPSWLDRTSCINQVSQVKESVEVIIGSADLEIQKHQGGRI